MNTAVAVRSVSHDFVSYAVTSTQLKSQIQLIQRVLADVMIQDVHYGKIPGTDRPTLFKAGAEVLCATFRIAPMYRTEDLSTHDCARYRVTCLGKSQVSGLELGEGIGEASTDEAKYKWRQPVCDEEFEATDEAYRRVKWFKGRNGGKPYSAKQIRTEPADSANTCLKMAAKRALVAMVLNVLAASDLFSQDLEDIEDIEGDGNQRRPARQVGRPARSTTPPQSNGGNGKITDAQKKLIFARLNAAGMSAEQLCKRFNVESVVELPFTQVNDALSFIADPERDAIQREAEGSAE
jgi:hypothetical protein